MRRYLRVSILLMSVVVATLSMAGPALAGPLRSTALTHTKRTIVRPVNASGHAVTGYTVKAGSNGPVDCSAKQASPAAVDANILFCGPDAAYAIACWRAAAKHHVLCLPDARGNTLVRYRVSGSIASVKPFHVRDPLNMRLGNGLYCELRAGGAASSLKHHPHFAVVYYCTHGQAIWAPMDSSGINRTHAVWHVRTAPASGDGSLVSRRVERAWFVGTKH